MNCVQYALDEMGYTEYTPEMLKRFIGPPLYEAFREHFLMSDEQALKAVEIYRSRFSEVGWAENSVYQGIPRLIRSLKQHGVYIALASAKPKKFAVRILEHFGLLDAFDRVVAIEMGDMHADKPELVRRALPDQYERACMVGDRSYDMIGGRENGIDAIGVAYGYGTREELVTSGADRVVDTVEELTDCLLGGRAPAKGRFITFEGTDGSGKTTQLKRLSEFLTACGHRVRLTREPGGAPVSESIRELVLDVRQVGMTPLCEAYLFAAARAQHVAEVIAPAIERGDIVISDRFVDSNIAYQGAGRRLGAELIRSINGPAVAGCMPELTLFFDINPETAIARRRADTEVDRIEAEGDALHRRVYEGFQQLLREEPERIRRVDAEGAPEQIEIEVRKIVMEALGR